MRQHQRKHRPSFKARVAKKDDAMLIAQLYQHIGQLKVERDFLESILGS